MSENYPESIIFFDGICNFCNASVNLIIRYDKHKKFSFAPLQSENAKAILKERSASFDFTKIDTIVLLLDTKLYTHSSAALRIAKELSFPFSLLYLFIIIPAPIRDFFYTLIAKHRYRLFGKRDSCMIPNQDIRNRFLN